MGLSLCFEISVNDSPPVLAGLEGIDVLVAALTFVAAHDELELRAGGLVSRGRHDNEHLEWIERALKRGDRVSIRIVEAAQPSAPVSRRRENPDESEQRERAYYDKLRKRYEAE